MNSVTYETGVPSSAENVVGDAVGMEKEKWYVAIVGHNREKKVSTYLTDLGIENYVPVQTEKRVWSNGRKAKVERVVIPSKIFIKCTPRKRRELVEYSFINRFMTDRTIPLGPTGVRPLATIPDRQIEILKFMLGQSDIPVSITESAYKPGDKVRVIRGHLQGLEGTIQRVDDRTSILSIYVELVGVARLQINPNDVAPVDSLS